MDEPGFHITKKEAVARVTRFRVLLRPRDVHVLFRAGKVRDERRNGDGPRSTAAYLEKSPKQ
jgi:hypothetical protein